MTTKNAPQPVLPTDAEIDQAVREAYESHGLISEDTGRLDMREVRRRMLEELASRKVETRKERQVKALSAGDLVKCVFPELPGPGSFEEQDNPVLAEKVWARLLKKLYDETKPSATGALQRQVSEYMGNGYVILRTTLASSAKAAYISDNRECVTEDLIVPENKSLRNAAERVTRTREMLIQRQPHNAAFYATQSIRELKGIQETASQRIALAASATSATPAAVNNDEDGED